MKTKADIGVLGMGTMGGMLALNLAEKGNETAIFNRTAEKTHRLVADNPDLAPRLHPEETLEAFVAGLKTPRVVLVMVNAGAPVDEQIAHLTPLLEAGDIIIDGGNADFNDTVRRSKAAEGTGIHFVGMGVSGGEQGARHGPSIMVGGAKDVWQRLQPILEPISAKHEGEPCVAWLGPDGAGHFVKTIHNGIEYADMQMIAEIYGLLRDGAKLEAPAIGAIFADWNTRGLSSYLIEITAAVLAEPDEKTGRPLVDLIIDEAGQKGTGRWSVIEAQKLGIGATTLEAAVSARGISSRRDERIAAAGIFDGIALETSGAVAADAASIAELESALETAKIIAYAQGYAVLASASEEYGWDLPLRDIARIWRAGCIIRSVFLDDIAKVYEAGDGIVNLLQAPSFSARVASGQEALRRVVSRAVLAGLPVPALSAALSYFDDYRRARGTANLVQGQRDFFGAHTYRRFDADGAHHHVWPVI
ncbi:MULTISPECIES: NADP-dependent phosphogluconate dehydrogenase [unclassified Aureimonas]|uniref:NADP-dependent phosphogluconate dehydrogenase n=1 Tax=unclassified Aureimonas TaxID=2615206 RepID=UPI0006FAF758|nr:MULTISPECIES: NADP-dependent phosphogluconate dehydrogenase [unclassified Aureimonas]KQT57367.1 6-phosphogluconate dehydrogenase [Aureimonas sp. Leaf427]KQT77045.1 6-phosphogluconate dehydrogenase [Aureimonas sp. Leaf460]